MWDKIPATVPSDYVLASRQCLQPNTSAERCIFTQALFIIQAVIIAGQCQEHKPSTALRPAKGGQVVKENSK